MFVLNDGKLVAMKQKGFEKETGFQTLLEQMSGDTQIPEECHTASFTALYPRTSREVLHLNTGSLLL
jgi:hypothetical protein